MPDLKSKAGESVDSSRLVGPDLPEVGGRILSCSCAEFERRCRLYLLREQERSMPDNAMIALLCDGVRLAREYGDAMNGLRSNAEGLRSADRRRDADKQHPLVGPSEYGD